MGSGYIMLFIRSVDGLPDSTLITPVVPPSDALDDLLQSIGMDGRLVVDATGTVNGDRSSDCFDVTEVHSITGVDVEEDAYHAR